jgi:hypothetical protein
MSKKKLPRLRVLSKVEVEVLKFIWKWKLANMLTLKFAVAPAKSIWKFYQGLRRLLAEGYLKEISDSGAEIPLWTLTKKGFNFINGGNEALREERYQPQSVTHDYWASAFHLGDFIYGTPARVEMISEQELNAHDPECMKDWVPKGREHIPDGLTLIKMDMKNVVLAFETELSPKTLARYEDMIRYLDHHDEIDLVFWLCADDYLIERITTKIVTLPRRQKAKHNFVRLNDFQKLGWRSPIVWGSKTKQTVREIMGQYGVNTLGNTGLIVGYPEPIEVFCSPIKSPKGLKT